MAWVHDQRRLRPTPAISTGAPWDVWSATNGTRQRRTHLAAVILGPLLVMAVYACTRYCSRRCTWG